MASLQARSLNPAALSSVHALYNRIYSRISLFGHDGLSALTCAKALGIPSASYAIMLSIQISAESHLHQLREEGTHICYNFPATLVLCCKNPGTYSLLAMLAFRVWRISSRSIFERTMSNDGNANAWKFMMTMLNPRRLLHA